MLFGLFFVCVFLHKNGKKKPVFLWNSVRRLDETECKQYNGNNNYRKHEVTGMTFSEMPYERVDCAAVKQELAALTASLKAAADYARAKEVFLRKDKLARHVSTLYNLAYIRHSINTKDAFYDGEIKFWNGALPEIQEEEQNWTLALLANPFRADFAREYGEILFTNAELQLKSFSPAIIPELQEESDLAQEYEKLLASAQIPFEGDVYTLSQLSPFKNDPDDARRLAA